VCAVHVLN
ncbi:hypothetical protein SLEP1_g59398, partial [Rubroshorea leprosula]